MDTINNNQFPNRFKLISFYEKEWEESKNLLLALKAFCINENNAIEEKFNKLSKLIQKFQIQNRTYKYKTEDKFSKYYMSKNCSNLKEAIESYFQKNQSKFYIKLLPFIIDQALLLEERTKNKYGE